MPTLTITRGLPGSGKTTWARQQPGAVRVNRDELRLMLHGSRLGTDSAERHVTVVHRQAIASLLREGVDVICDDTNLKSKVVRELMDIADSCGADVVLEDFTAVPVDECVARDAARADGERVGEHVIRDMWQRYLSGNKLPLPTPIPRASNVELVVAASQPVRYRPPKGAPEAVLVDIDGTVALRGDRSPYDMTRVHVDEPNVPVIAAIRAMHQSGHRILFCSGRSDDCRDATLAWLDRHVGVPVEALHMRVTGDNRQDSVVKAEIFDREIRQRYRVIGVFDDRNQVVKYWRSIGLTVFQVADGDF